MNVLLRKRISFSLCHVSVIVNGVLVWFRAGQDCASLNFWVTMTRTIYSLRYVRVLSTHTHTHL